MTALRFPATKWIMLDLDGSRVYSNIFSVQKNHEDPIDEDFPFESEDFAWVQKELNFSWGNTGVKTNKKFYPGDWSEETDEFGDKDTFITDRFIITTVEAWYSHLNLDLVDLLDLRHLARNW